MRESGATVNDTPKIQYTDLTSKYHFITFSKSELKIPLHINGIFYLFHTRSTTADELQSCEKIFITTNHQNWNTYCKLYELNERPMWNYEGGSLRKFCEEHHLVDYELDDINIYSITATACEQHIYKSTDNAYCAHAYNTPSNLHSEFASAFNQRSEISKMMWQLVAPLKVICPVNCFLIQSLANCRN